MLFNYLTKRGLSLQRVKFEKSILSASLIAIYAWIYAYKITAFSQLYKVVKIINFNNTFDSLASFNCCVCRLTVVVTDSIE